MTPEFPTASLDAVIENIDHPSDSQEQQPTALLHAYCAGRLILEGGFPPEWVAPRQPFASTKLSHQEYQLRPFPRCQQTLRRRVLGAIGYKDLDVTVFLPELGPALAISGKSTGNAFRNLTNRMEEALGECTNIHLMYPGLVFGFLHLIKFAALPEAGTLPDASFDENEEALPSIRRYHDVMVALGGRSTITDPGMRYEAVGLLVYRSTAYGPTIWNKYPPSDSPVHFSKFFQRLYDLYDLRFGYPDPDGPNIRKVWRPQSELPESFDKSLRFEWQPRLAE